MSNQRTLRTKIPSLVWGTSSTAPLAWIHPCLHSLLSGTVYFWSPTCNYKKEHLLGIPCHCLRNSPNLCASPFASTMEKVDSPASPAYSDAEKGVLDSLPVQLSYFPRDKKDPGILTAQTKPAPPPAAKPKKKRASKWVLWRIWFNTYRSCLSFRHLSVIDALLFAPAGSSSRLCSL